MDQWENRQRPIRAVLMSSPSPIAATWTVRARRLDDVALVHAAQAGEENAFACLLGRYQALLEHHVRRFYLPGGDRDDVDQEARIGFAKAVRCYRGERGSSFHTFAELCVSRQLSTALTRARRLKQRPLNEAAGGEAAERAWTRLPDREDPLSRVLARERLVELAQASQRLSALERRALAHALAGWSTGQTARRLGIERKSADNALQRAQRKVEAWYERDAA